MTLPAHLEIFTTSSGAEIVRCKDCGATEPHAKLLRHYKRCDVKSGQGERIDLAAPAAPAPTSAAAVSRSFERAEAVREIKAGGAGHYDAADVVDLVRGGFVSVNDAMNSDF